jgi:hypothetical protein
MQTIPEAYGLYLTAYASTRPMSFAKPLVDFVDWLREQGIDAQFSDEEWIEFLLPSVGGDEDRARDLWDALLCQPSYEQDH